MFKGDICIRLEDLVATKYNEIHSNYQQHRCTEKCEIFGDCMSPSSDRDSDCQIRMMVFYLRKSRLINRVDLVVMLVTDGNYAAKI
jgi:hypothetical protein